MLDTRVWRAKPYDLCISALDAVLETNNTRHFSRIPDLLIENWATGSPAKRK
jgi:predicted nucleic acid-binding protein